MLRYLLALCLITCTVGYSSVWAFDGHFDEWTQHAEMSGATDHGEDGEDHSSCDHCCHAAAHLTGLWTNQPVLSIPETSGVWSHCHNAYHSILTGPPDHPPKT